MLYSYFDAYDAMSDLQLNLCTHFRIYRCESSLWGLGELNARAPRLPVSKPCPTSQDQVFWDQYHPTEAASQIFADRILDGLSTYTYPINTRQLLQLTFISNDFFFVMCLFFSERASAACHTWESLFMAELHGLLGSFELAN
ncbi:unnamed protein product [Lathyrus sativus]|nr:unnamed protein product [Lathyrus sativus]